MCSSTDSSLARSRSRQVAPHLIDGLENGSHTVRIEVLTESQAGPNEFHGFALLKSDKARPSTPRGWQIEFIGDSHTVGYGNTSKTRDCSSDEVWATTDNARMLRSESCQPRTVADYQIHADFRPRHRPQLQSAEIHPAFHSASDHSALCDAASPGTAQRRIVDRARHESEISRSMHREKWATRDALHATMKRL